MFPTRDIQSRWHLKSRRGVTSGAVANVQVTPG